MPKNASRNSKFRKRLKAADKRRNSRPQVSKEVPVPSVAAVDVLGLLVEATVNYAEQNPAIGDGAVIVALKSVDGGLPPTGEHSKPLFDEYAKIAEAPDVSLRELRAAAKQMFELAGQHRASDKVSGGVRQDSTSFLAYLGMLV